MSKKPRAVVFVSIALLTVLFGVLTANAQVSQTNAGCTTGKFVGSYIRSIPFPDAWGDGSNVAHTVVFQLTLHSDGTATEDYTGLPDLLLSFGTSARPVGTWACRGDGKLVVTLISANYGPTTDAINHPTTVPSPPPVDTFLLGSSRGTFLFTVTDDNTLTRIQMRRRGYLPAEDPSDPAAGTLGPLNTKQVVFKRLTASDADLMAP